MQKCDATFKKIIRLNCYDSLQQSGFTRYRKESVDWPLYDGFHVWVGLNTGLYPERVEINPFVGIHVKQIMNLYVELESRKYDRGVATYAIHMGELDGAKEEIAFAFTPQQSEEFIQSETERLAELYLNVGMPYARSIASYEALLPLLMERVPMMGGYPQRVASCLYLMGRKDDARKFVEEYLPKHQEIFEGFAIPFLKKLDDESRLNIE
jgi:hypothetical protein